MAKTKNVYVSGKDDKGHEFEAGLKVLPGMDRAKIKQTFEALGCTDVLVADTKRALAALEAASQPYTANLSPCAECGQPTPDKAPSLPGLPLCPICQAALEADHA